MIFSALAWVIKYPDTIVAEVQLLTENPAIRIMPLASGKLEELLIKNQQTVEKGALLAILESPASSADIEKLEQLLIQIGKAKLPQDYLAIKMQSTLILGNMQNSYANLSQRLIDYQYYLSQISFDNKVSILKDQNNSYQSNQ